MSITKIAKLDESDFPKSYSQVAWFSEGQYEGKLLQGEQYMAEEERIGNKKVYYGVLSLASISVSQSQRAFELLRLEFDE